MLRLFGHTINIDNGMAPGTMLLIVGGILTLYFLRTKGDDDELTYLYCTYMMAGLTATVVLSRFSNVMLLRVFTVLLLVLAGVSFMMAIGHTLRRDAVLAIACYLLTTLCLSTGAATGEHIGWKGAPGMQDMNHFMVRLSLFVVVPALLAALLFRALAPTVKRLRARNRT